MQSGHLWTSGLGRPAATRDFSRPYRVVQRGRVVKRRRLVLMRGGLLLSKLNRALSLCRGADLGFD